MTALYAIIAAEWLGLLAFVTLRLWVDSHPRRADTTPLWWAEYDAARHIEALGALKRIEKEEHDEGTCRV
jgi:hypothetical protein